MNIVIIYIIIAFITLLTGIFFLKREKTNFLIFLYLLVSFLSEFFGYLISLKDIFGGNTFVFNIYTYLEYSIHLLILYNLFKNVIDKILVKYSIILFWIIILIFNIFQIESFFIDQKYLYTIGTVFFLILSFKYFISIFKKNDYYEFDKTVFFWYLLGIILFNIAYIPLLFIVNDFIKIDFLLYNILLIFLNILKNGFIIFGIIWTQKK